MVTVKIPDSALPYIIEAARNPSQFNIQYSVDNCSKKSWDFAGWLKVPKCEIFDRSDFYYFYTIKPFWIDDFGVKILTYFFKFWGSQASFSFLCAS